MPLLDHFHPPLSERRHWHSFHNSWATYLSSQLNAILPAGYFAEANVQFGVEINGAAVQEAGSVEPATGWTPPLRRRRILSMSPAPWSRLASSAVPGGRNWRGQLNSSVPPTRIVPRIARRSCRNARPICGPASVSSSSTSSPNGPPTFTVNCSCVWERLTPARAPL